MHRDDERIARLMRAIRHEARLTQAQLALAAQVPLNDIKRLEGGRAGEVRLGRIRRVLESQGGRGRLVPWWNGAEADRLLDARHAALVERATRALVARGWQVQAEVSFAEYGERGSIDVLGGLAGRRALIVGEVKSAIGSLEETNRVLDAKERLAPTIAQRRFGWRPAAVCRLLILPRSSSVRRVIARHTATMDAIYPARGPEIRAWLRDPSGPLRGIWFVSDGPDRSAVHG